MSEILDLFKQESLSIISKIDVILDDISANPEKNELLEEFGQNIDRIMGAAKNLEVSGELPEIMGRIGEFCQLCKAIGYKGSQVSSPELTTIVAAFLMDAIDLLNGFILRVETLTQDDVSGLISATFLERLKWMNEKMGDNLRSSVAINKDKKEQ